jgi:hypothetical protein
MLENLLKQNSIHNKHSCKTKGTFSCDIRSYFISYVENIGSNQGKYLYFYPFEDQT